MEQMSSEATGFVPQTVVHAPELTACDCGHDVVRHDRTALRYCQATASNKLRRDCICNVAQAQPMSRR